MPGFKPFLAGMLAGGCLAAGALQYHVVRSDEGMYLVPRSPKPSLTLAYADTRAWTDEQWERYPALVNALKANGAADLLHNDAQSMSLNELRDAMQGSLNDPASFAVDGDSTFTANKPVDRVRDTLDPVPIGNVDQRRRDGFLDDVRNELNSSFGDEAFSSNRTGRSSATLSGSQDSLRNARERMKSTVNDTLSDNTFSEPFDDYNSRTESVLGSDDSYSDFDALDDLRRRSFESDAVDSGAVRSGAGQGDAEEYLSAPKFDDDDDILNRFTPRSGAANRASAVTLDDSWAADPWAQASHTTESDSLGSAVQAESSGWTATAKGAAKKALTKETTGGVASVLDRFKESAGGVASGVASDTLNQTRRAITDPLESTFNGVREKALGAVSDSVKQHSGSAADWIGDSVGDALKPDSDGFLSPFSELLD